MRNSDKNSIDHHREKAHSLVNHRETSHSRWICKGDQEMGESHTVFETRGDASLAGEIEGGSCWFQQEWFQNLVRVASAEMMGTFVLMFSVCGIIASTVLSKGEVGLLEYASTGGFATIVVFFSVGPISGAHVNPAVTIAFAICGQFPLSKVPLYISAQVLGSILATLIGKSVYGMGADFATTSPVHGLHAAFWAEFIATLFIMFLVSALSSHNAKPGGPLCGVAVGATIALAVLITGPVSGGSLNPARSLGPAIVSNKYEGIWVYLVAPTIGAVVGAMLYKLLSYQPRHFHHDHSPPCDTLVSNDCVDISM